MGLVDPLVRVSVDMDSKFTRLILPKLEKLHSLKSAEPLDGYVVCLLLLLSLSGVAHAQQTSVPADYIQYVRSTIISVFNDGSAEVKQTLVLPDNISSLTIPLFAKQVGNILALNQGGSPVSYAISGGNIALYTLGATLVSLEYGTDALTSKQGTVWDVSFDSPFNMTLVLPSQSTILSFSGAPTTLSTANGSPTLVLAAGSWDISYGLPIGVSTSTKSTTTATGNSGTTTTQSTGPKPTPLTPLMSPLTITAGAVAIVVAAAAFLARGRIRVIGASAGLRFDDREILRFMKEKGGKVIEREIRERFSLARTSAWRQAKRLERLGYVRISKLGTQNQIELLREDFELPR